MQDRRLIEETFPVREISEESAKEKSVRHSHISTLHIWWARRPLCSSRATNYAALVGLPHNDEYEKERNFIIELSKWENSSDQQLLNIAKKKIIENNDGKAPKVLDPFGGGGSIPLEALRLGCETYCSDYNPVSVIVQKCGVEIPLKYRSNDSTATGDVSFDNRKNSFYQALNKWGKSIFEEAWKEIGKFYPLEKDGSTPIGYMWARTIPCQNPHCGAQIPLIKQYVLSKKEKNVISLCPYVKGKYVQFKVVGRGYESPPKNFDPLKGTISRAIASCLVCGSVVEGKLINKLFTEGKSSERMLCVIIHEEGISGKKYRVANENDIAVFKDAENKMKRKRQELMEKWGIDPIPDEPIPPKNSHRAVGSQLPLYNFETFGDLFNSRQKLNLLVFSEKVRDSYCKMKAEGYEDDYARDLTTFLALGVSRLADFGSSLCVLNPTGGRGIVHTFGRQALQMVWDYSESNPFYQLAAGWVTACEKNAKWIEHASQIRNNPAKILQASATSIPYPDNYFDAVITDPPYYDNVPYSYLSDFFYVWLKRTIGDLYPELFATPLTPKKEEIVVYAPRDGAEKGKEFFEQMLKKSFSEINRVLRSNGIAVIVYAHKSTAGWETLINSLLDSGLVVTGAWPIHTEMRGRLNASETAALASSIYMIARKISREPIGFYKNVRDELKKYLNQKLERLWKEGISGADFFISAIGSSIEIFGKYEKIIDDEENTIRADRLLEEVRKIVTDYAVRQVLHNGFAAEVSQLTRFYVLWRWAYGEANVLFDDARKLSQSVGIDIVAEWNKGFIRKDKEFIRILGPEDRKQEELKGAKELIDVLHNVLLLWKKSKNEEIIDVLKNTGFGKSDVFYKVAQAISESLPNDSKEKKLLEGFLVGRERISKDVRRSSGQRRLFEE